jgi:hypothetical protein
MLPLAQADYSDATTITTNYGIHLLTPDFYFLTDFRACHKFSELSKEVQKSHGTKVVTLKRKPSAMEARKIDHADIVLELVRHCGYDLNAYSDCQLSGLFCLQFAIRNGADTIAAVGHEGYETSKNKGKPYWYETPEEASVFAHQRLTTNVIGPFWRDIVEAHPDVTFHLYGNPKFEISGDNIRITKDEN